MRLKHMDLSVDFLTCDVIIIKKQYIHRYELYTGEYNVIFFNEYNFYTFLFIFYVFVVL